LNKSAKGGIQCVDASTAEELDFTR
jgi:hypothetical protein